MATTITHLDQIDLSPGEIRRYWLEVGHAWTGGLRVPLAVARGREPGAKLVVLACQHGDEGYGVLGLLDLINTLDPTALRGEVWILPCVNVFGFTAGHRVSPFDYQDMNRVHPGVSTGTITEQIAHALHQAVFPGADLILDLHGGSPENGDSAFGMWMDVDGKPPAAPIIASLGLDFLIGKRKQAPGMLSGSAAEMGIPQISIEAGNVTRYARDNGAQMMGFAMGCMQHLGMIAGDPPTPKPLPLMRMTTYRAQVGGAYKTLVSFGQQVEAGMRLGVVMNLVGEIAQELHAEEAGIVAVMRTGVRVHPGETLITLATPTGETI